MVPIPTWGALKPVGVGPSPTLLGCCWDQLTPSPLLRGKPVLGTGTHSWGRAVLWGRGMEVHRDVSKASTIPHLPPLPTSKHSPSPTTPSPIPNHSQSPTPQNTELGVGAGGTTRAGSQDPRARPSPW